MRKRHLVISRKKLLKKMLTQIHEKLEECELNLIKAVCKNHQFEIGKQRHIACNVRNDTQICTFPVFIQ